MNKMVYIIGLLALGLLAGYFSGLVGIGGGIIIVPVLVMLFGMSQHQAQGTTLALMVPPIGILAAMTYYQKGFVDIKVSALVCVGFVLGGYLGGKMSVAIPEQTLKTVFACLLIVVGLRMLLTGNNIFK